LSGGTGADSAPAPDASGLEPPPLTPGVGNPLGVAQSSRATQGHGRTLVAGQNGSASVAIGRPNMAIPFICWRPLCKGTVLPPPLTGPPTGGLTPAGHFQMRLVGIVGAKYQIEAATDLRAWMPLGPLGP
jgi:hypothetical protein